jgi:hypothetical protein
MQQGVIHLSAGFYDNGTMAIKIALPCLLKHFSLFQLGIGRNVLFVLFHLELFRKFLDLPHHGPHAHVLLLALHALLFNDVAVLLLS